LLLCLLALYPKIKVTARIEYDLTHCVCLYLFIHVGFSLCCFTEVWYFIRCAFQVLQIFVSRVLRNCVCPVVERFLCVERFHVRTREPSFGG
jgi:hypothetical protein